MTNIYSLLQICILRHCLFPPLGDKKGHHRISKLLLFNFPFIFSLFLFSFDVLCFKTKMLPSFLFFFSRRESRERADVICWLLTLWKGNRQTGVDWGEVKLFILPFMCYTFPF